jgi:hypothetical protein
MDKIKSNIVLGEAYHKAKTEKEQNIIIEKIFNKNKNYVKSLAFKDDLGKIQEDVAQNFYLILHNDMDKFDINLGDLNKFLLGLIAKTLRQSKKESLIMGLHFKRVEEETTKGIVSKMVPDNIPVDSLNKKIFEGDNKEVIENVPSENPEQINEYWKTVNYLLDNKIITQKEYEILNLKMVYNFSHKQIKDYIYSKYDTNICQEVIRKVYNKSLYKIKLHNKAYKGFLF